MLFALSEDTRQRVYNRRSLITPEVLKKAYIRKNNPFNFSRKQWLQDLIEALSKANGLRGDDLARKMQIHSKCLKFTVSETDIFF